MISGMLKDPCSSHLGVSVIWHYHERMELKTVPVPAKAGVHNDAARWIWKDPTFRCAESDEENLVVGLKVRKLTTIVIAALHGSVISIGSSESGDPSWRVL